MKLDYTGGGNMTLKVNNTTRITLSSIPSAFGEGPDWVFWGSSYNGSVATLQGDACVQGPPGKGGIIFVGTGGWPVW